jgi:hypothetical protein
MCRLSQPHLRLKLFLKDRSAIQQQQARLVGRIAYLSASLLSAVSVNVAGFAGTFFRARGFAEQIRRRPHVHQQTTSRRPSRRRGQGGEHWTKRDKTTGQFMDQKTDDERFKGVRKE